MSRLCDPPNLLWAPDGVGPSMGDRPRRARRAHMTATTRCVRMSVATASKFFSVVRSYTLPLERSHTEARQPSPPPPPPCRRTDLASGDIFRRLFTMLAGKGSFSRCGTEQVLLLSGGGCAEILMPRRQSRERLAEASMLLVPEKALVCLPSAPSLCLLIVAVAGRHIYGGAAVAGLVRYC